MNQTTAFLIAVKERIGTPELWCQNAARRGEKRCLGLAMNEVESSLPVYQEAREVLLDRIAANGHRSVNLVGFNDDPQTNHQDVMQVFDEAIILSV